MSQRKSLELKLLKKIPSKYYAQPNRVWSEDPPGLTREWNSGHWADDAYHVKLRIASRYCSMDQLKTYLQTLMPYESFREWSMTGGDNNRDVVVTIHGETIVIPYDIYDHLKTEHVDERIFIMEDEAWSIELPYGEHAWLEPVLPCYMDLKTIKKLAELRYGFARTSSFDDLTQRISDAGFSGVMSPDVTGFLSDGLAWARKRRRALYASLAD